MDRDRQRKLNRLKKYDYSSFGYYFVTICTKNKVNHFGKVVGGNMILNKYGEIVKKQWLWLEQQYNFVHLDEWIIMPNHFHGIIIINNRLIHNVGTGRDLSVQKIKSLSGLIGAFKTTSSKIIHQNNLYSFQWHRSFYDHIIRREEFLPIIREYILTNPMRWEEEKNNEEDLFM